MQNGAGGGNYFDGTSSRSGAVREITQSQPQTPQTTIKDVCRLCEDPFIVQNNKHCLFLSHNDVKTPYTLALEELTGPIKTTDVLTFIC